VLDQLAARTSTGTSTSASTSTNTSASASASTSTSSSTTSTSTSSSTTSSSSSSKSHGTPPSSDPDAAATAGDDDQASDADVETVKATKSKKSSSSDTDATSTKRTKETHDKANTHQTKQTHDAKTLHTPSSCGKGCSKTSDDDDDAAVEENDDDGVSVTDGMVKKSKPHLFLITLDDVGHNDIGWISRDMPGASPVLSEMASQGIIFDNYYGQTTCTPARSTIMSGKFTHRTGFQDQEMTVYSDFSLAVNMTLLPAALKAGGYKAYGVGKWNLGHCNIAYMPWNRGFDKFFTQTMSGIHYYNHTHDTMHYDGATYDLYDLLEGEADDGMGTFKPALDYQGVYSTNAYQDNALTYIQAHNKEYPDNVVPMFLWLAFHGVHSDGGDPKWEEMSETHQKYVHTLKHQGSDADRLRTAMAMLVIDNSVDKVVQNLEAYGMLSSSVIVVHSDNGGVPCGDTENNMQGSNYPLRGGKFNYFEGGLKVPAMVFAPGYLTTDQKGTRYAGLMHHVDLYTTFMAIAEIEVNHDEMVLDGFDHWDAIRGLAPSPRSEIVFNINQVFNNVDYGFENASIAYRYGDIKLLMFHANDTWYDEAGFITYSSTGSDQCVERSCSTSERYVSAWKDNLCGWGHFLFNITADPTESVNLYYEPKYQRELNRLKEKVKNHHRNGYWQSKNWQYSASHAAMTEFYNHDNYVVPWNCPLAAAEH